MENSCKHRWICGQPKKDGDKRVTHEKCVCCKGERDLIETFNPYNAKHTAIVYPAKERVPECASRLQNEIIQAAQDVKENKDDSIQIEIKIIQAKEENTMGIGGNTKEKSRKYLERKPEILECVKRHNGKIKTAAEELDMPEQTLRGLINRWEKEDAAQETLVNQTGSSSPAAGSSGDIDIKELGTRDRYLYFESHAAEIIKDIESGMRLNDVMTKWKISSKALLNFRHRHGLLVDTQMTAQRKAREELITLFEKVLTQTDTIENARACWQGVKIVLGIE